LPLYVKLMLPASVVIRPLQGDVPTIELVLGYSRSNTSALLKRFLAQADQLIARVVKPGAEFLSAPERIISIPSEAPGAVRLPNFGGTTSEIPRRRLGQQGD
jgi:hypothetical protein